MHMVDSNRHIIDIDMTIMTIEAEVLMLKVLMICRQRAVK